MDPLAPATSTLSPAISHIAETASTLSSALVDRTSRAQSATASAKRSDDQIKKQTVKWVLQTPERMERHLAEGRKPAAEKEFDDVAPLLERWKTVDGVEELRKKCESLLGDDDEP